MDRRIALAGIEDMVGRLDPALEGQQEDVGYRTAIVLLAAISVGPAVDAVVALTGYEKEFVTAIADRLRLAGL